MDKRPIKQAKCLNDGGVCRLEECDRDYCQMEANDDATLRRAEEIKARRAIRPTLKADT